MHIYGLTGGIAAGKTKVSQYFRELGAAVVDADVLARKAVEPGSAGLRAIDRHFPGVLDPHGQLDRSKLGRLIFNQANQRTLLNSILHPLIHVLYLSEINHYQSQGAGEVIYDAALLLENGLQVQMNGVILVVASLEVRLQRLMSRNGFSEKEARVRVESQMPQDAKLRHARWVIENTGTYESTQHQVANVFEQIKQLR